jgi:hypothetical protein
MAGNACAFVLGIVLAESAFAGGVPEAGENLRLRCIDKRACSAVQGGLASSTTFRALADRIENSDLIVYVRMGEVRPGTVGATQLFASSGGTRFILVTIKPLAVHTEIIARLGHELQHVTEIADDPGAHDDDSVRALFRRIGWAAGYDAWETAAAVRSGRQVLEESLDGPRNETRLARQASGSPTASWSTRSDAPAASGPTTRKPKS